MDSDTELLYYPQFANPRSFQVTYRHSIYIAKDWRTSFKEQKDPLRPSSAGAAAGEMWNCDIFKWKAELNIRRSTVFVDDWMLYPTLINLFCNWFGRKLFSNQRPQHLDTSRTCRLTRLKSKLKLLAGAQSKLCKDARHATIWVTYIPFHKILIVSINRRLISKHVVYACGIVVSLRNLNCTLTNNYNFYVKRVNL